MNLPKLKVLKAEVRDAVSCSQRDYCSTCVFYKQNGGRCEGCTPKHREQMAEDFQWCHQECHECTGYRTKYTAICCRSPLKRVYLDAVTKGAQDWNHPEYEYTERERLEFKRKAIFYYTFGSASKMCSESGHDVLVDHEVVAVNLSHVKRLGKGFFAPNVKKYLRAPEKSKLILTTMSIDDHLERAWDNSEYGDGDTYKAAGIDYWMPLAFSSYPSKEPRMHHFYQFCRTQYCVERSQPHFYPAYYLSPGFNLADLHKKALAKIPQVMFNAQFFTGSEDSLREQMLYVRRWHELAPKDTAFWFVGPSTPTLIHNLRRVAAKRDCYWLSAKPLYLAVNGKQLRPDGGEKKLPPTVRVDKVALTRDNYDVFASMVRSYGR